jgi:hypothetical protein
MVYLEFIILPCEKIRPFGIAEPNGYGFFDSFIAELLTTC